MYDRPDLFQLLGAVRAYLQDDATPVDRQRQAAINLLGMVEREIQMSADHLKAEWARLNYVQNVTTPLPADFQEAHTALTERNRKFCEEISAGRYDIAPGRAALFEHLLMNAHAQLEVANPDFLQALAVEEAKRAR